MERERDGIRMSRRDLMVAGGAAAAASLLGRVVPASAAETPAVEQWVKNGRIPQSVSKWCYGRYPLDEFAAICQKMGLKGIDLLGPGDFATLKKYGLVCTMTNTTSIPKGLNRKENHDEILAKLREAIDATSAAGFPNVITFSGNRAGMPDDEGLKNCVEGLKKIAGYAEEKKVTICMELLNSKRNHKDYMCDHTAWGAAMCKAVGSPRVKLLYDIYHMQIQEGDVIATLREFKEYIGHVHTGGVPGRSNLDETQELNYPPIMHALIDMGYTGYVAHEFMPRGDAITALGQAVKLCDI